MKEHPLRSHNCHTGLPCDLSEQHHCIIHSQLCSLCNTKIHFLIPILTGHCLQVDDLDLDGERIDEISALIKEKFSFIFC